QDLRVALEHSATYFVLEKGQPIFYPKYVDPKPQYYNYDMYEGSEYTLDLRPPFGERETKRTSQGKAVQAEEVLEIVTNQD
ncbi:bifunctional metallophosphatase/5'-nucleotidase, partial [Enterococcus faecalis]